MLLHNVSILNCYLFASIESNLGDFYSSLSVLHQNEYNKTNPYRKMIAVS
jgi:hypothetical protein